MPYAALLLTALLGLNVAGQDTSGGELLPFSYNEWITDVLNWDMELSHRNWAMNTRGPMSLTMLMNFGSDGTFSFQLSDSNAIMWNDFGNCKNGYAYDPQKHVCREIFCENGFLFVDTKCTEINSTESSKSKEILFEFTIDSKINCTSLNSSIKHCCKNLIMEAPDLIQSLTNLLSAEMNVSKSRLGNLTLIQHYVNYYVDSTSTNNQSNLDLCASPDTAPALSDPETDSGPKILYDVNKFKVTLATKEEGSSDKESVRAYFDFMQTTMDHEEKMLCKRIVRFSNVKELKTNTSSGWCKGVGDKERPYFKDQFQILSSTAGTKNYIIYINATKTYYPSGFYYLTMFYTSSAQKMASAEQRAILSEPRLNQLNPWDTDFTALNLTDVTSQILKPAAASFANNLKMTYVLVCDRGPKIRKKCSSHMHFRISVSELIYFETNKSYCWPSYFKCYSIDEYELDLVCKNHSIRVCKEPDFSGNKDPGILAEDYSMLLPGWLSFSATTVSLSAMILTLITYALFKELRNIPGWNIINLTVALTIAQGSFLAGSIFNHMPEVCFAIALLTHYGFLAAFFWMNVIAFDLFRNFRDKSSHVLLLMVTVRARLPKYALYAWLSPLVIVLISISIDLIFTQIAETSSFRPCYAGLLEGCSNYVVLGDTNKIGRSASFRNTATQSTPVVLANQSDEDIPAHCFDTKQPDAISVSLLSTCWMQNGRATLTFFGLPIAIIIVVNALFYSFSVYNIRAKKNKHTKTLRRVSRMKLPGDEDIKFYIQMAFIMGFTWITGFIANTIESIQNSQFILLVITYVFILLNASTGCFIFAGFILKAKVRDLYWRLYKQSIAPRLASISGNSAIIVNRPSYGNRSVIDERNVKEQSGVPKPLSVVDLRLKAEHLFNSSRTIDTSLSRSSLDVSSIDQTYDNPKLNRCQSVPHKFAQSSVMRSNNNPDELYG
nr:G protein-coupled receptor [Proales similis]